LGCAVAEVRIHHVQYNPCIFWLVASEGEEIVKILHEFGRQLK
jgi:hypothetical protein